LADRIALAANLQVPGVFPVDADWRVRYVALPPSAEELARLEKAIELGAMTMADVRLIIDPFASPDEVDRAIVPTD